MKKIIFVFILNIALVVVYYVSMAKVSTERIMMVGDLEEQNEVLKQEIAAQSSISALTARASAMGLTKVKIEDLTPTSVARINP